MKTNTGSIIMSVKEVAFYGDPEKVSEHLKLLLASFSKNPTTTFEILRPQKRTTTELLADIRLSISSLIEQQNKLSKQLGNAIAIAEEWSQLKQL